MLNPEQLARQQIDAMLVAAGWAVQDHAAYNPGAARGIALREVPLISGRCDYLLIVDRQPLGVIEAKRAGTLLVGAAEQSAHYALHLPAFFKVQASEMPFAYESTGTQLLQRTPPSAAVRPFASSKSPAAPHTRNFPEPPEGWLGRTSINLLKWARALPRNAMCRLSTRAEPSNG